MQYFLLGLVLLLAVLMLGRVFVGADPKWLARHMRKIGGVIALFGGVFFFVTGRLPLAIPLLFLAYALLGRGFFFPWGPGAPGNARKSEGQASSVRTDMLEMRLDHDTGQMSGRVRQGRFAGRLLAELSFDDLLALWRECQTSDPQGARLLEAYMERIAPDWRGPGGGGPHQQGRPSNGAMTVGEAYQVLGLAPGASRADIQQAHRNLMKRFHPDHGGSSYLAAKINEAKDVLMRR